jgi:hypothetical protein
MKRTICIDFDGVIHDYSNGWQGVDVFGKAVNGASEGTAALKEYGWMIIIYTTRNDSPALRKWLSDNNIHYDYINENPNQPEGSDKGKLIANVYLDDRGILFDGNWEKAIERTLGFTPWQEAGNSCCSSYMSFSVALNALKRGMKVAREGWNGKGMFIYYVSEGRYPAKMDIAKEIADEDGLVSYGAYIAMKTAQGNVVPWLASQTDLLSEDWVIV